MSEICRSGLASQAFLNKIDQLRELNIKSIELPQLVVVGDQSSGKSSVLESLTGFAFPQDSGLCTRYVTQISCRRDPKQKVYVSIIPRSNVDAALQKRLREFKRTIPDLTSEAFAAIIKEANRAMGIRLSSDDCESDLQTFSEDILKIEMTGPEQEHFTVIDVPGIFRVSSPPLTTDMDMAIVRNMVESYMKNTRTIILAVLPSNVDIATQEILKMAEVADPDGARTMGVLTKPDLVTENATQDTMMSLVLGRRNQLRLGYCVVKNRNADDRNSTTAERVSQENEFFDEPKWRQVVSSGRCGIGSLKTRLSDLLTTISNKEFPNVKYDISKRLDACRNELQSLGPSRTRESSQRIYLGNLQSKFQTITQCALNGYYDSAMFTEFPSLKLITHVTKLNERFANDFWKKGHKRPFSESGHDGEKLYDAIESGGNCILDAPYVKYTELQELIDPIKYPCPKPKAANGDSIMDHIDKVYQWNRGAELGTFSGSILAAVFKEQSEKWPFLVCAHISRSIGLVHDYISSLLDSMCPDEQVRRRLWDLILLDELRNAYVRAMNHTHFLLQVERNGMPSTYNHYFNSEVQKKRQDRMNAAVKGEAFTCTKTDKTVVSAISVMSLHNLVVNKDNAQQVREDIHDVLASYYKVSRKRFVDVICRQVIGHFLLEGDESPLKIFSSELVMGLESEQLEAIAGEVPETKRRRAMLETEIENLEAALKVLRG